MEPSTPLNDGHELASVTVILGFCPDAHPATVVRPVGVAGKWRVQVRLDGADDGHAGKRGSQRIASMMRPCAKFWYAEDGVLRRGVIGGS